MDTTQELWVVLDLRGLVLQCYHSGTDHDAAKTVDGTALKTPGHTLTNLTERYLLPLLDLAPLNRIIAVNDAGNEYRKAILPTYKATRSQPEPEVRQSLEASTKAVRELLHSLGIAQVSVAGTEADDVIAYLVGKLPGRKLLYTVDGDMVALADELTTVFLKGQPAAVFGKGDLEVLPKHLTLFKSLVGDTSDNYKGVPGFGPSAWVKLQEEYGDDGLEELAEIAETQNFHKLLQILEAEPGQHKLLQKIQNGISEWRVSYEVAKLHPELVDGRWGQEFRRLRWEKRVPSRERLQALAEATHSSYLLNDFQAFLPQQLLIQAGDWDDSVLEEAKTLFAQSRFIALDWETWAPASTSFDKASTGEYVDMFGSKIAGMGITCGANLEYTFYFQFDHADKANNIDKDHLVELLKLIPEGMPIIAHNCYFELSVLKHELDYLLPNCHDTKVMASHVDETESAGLKDLSKRWLNYNQIHYRDVIEKGKTMRDYTGQHVFKYGADDPLVTAHLYDLLQTIMYLENTWEFVRENEFPAIYQLVDSYLAGVSLDWNEVDRQHQEDAKTFSDNLQQIREVIKANQGPEEVKAGALLWCAELQQDYDGDTRLMAAQLRQLEREPQPAVRLKETNTVLWGQLASGLADDSSYAEIIEVFEEVRLRGRIGLLTKAEKAVRYEDYSETLKDPNFTWIPKAINALAASYRLPSGLTKSDMSAYLDKLDTLAIRPELVQFCADLREVAEAEKNRSKLASYGRLQERYKTIAEGSLTKSGTELNLNSPLQMQALLYGTLQLPIRLRGFEVSESRALRNLPASPQTDKDVIAAAMAYGDAPEGSWRRQVLELLMEAKKADTRIKLFYAKFPLWRHPLDDMIHPQFNSVGTETRRPSGSSPNLLQLSKKGEGAKVRRCFIPNEKLGHDLIVSLDWSAFELRLVASISGDVNMKSCYLGNDLKDVHSMVAASIAGVTYDEFMAVRKGPDKEAAKAFDDIRKTAKNVIFGSNYSIGPSKLARLLLCSVEDAKNYLEAKKAVYYGIESWKLEVKKELNNKGYVTTQFGTRKHVFNRLNNSDDGFVSYLERSTVNHIIQATAADTLKRTISNLYKAKTMQRHGAVLIAGIYDELVMGCHHSQAVSLIQEVYAEMTKMVPGVDIPMLASPSVGKNFGDQIEVLEDENQPLTDGLIQVAIAKALGTNTELQEAA
jgi:DNA polymerase I-like protein with 3'-5' exonuclease and polymerase domains/5'-3' exonuclease